MDNKHVSAIINTLNEFLEDYDCEVKQDKEFAYYPAVSQITFALEVPTVFDETFMKFVTERHPDIKADVFLWSFLHEVGHHETEDDFDDDEWECYMRSIFSCNDDMEYYNLPIEAAATDWAADFMRTHSSETKILWEKLQPEILAYHKENF